MLGILALVAAAIALVGVFTRVYAQKSLAAETEARAIPQVNIVEPHQGSPLQEVVLPGNLYAYTESPVYSRTDGYLASWNYDIGATVHKGDLLAVISAPELDQQLIQARATLATSKANAAITSVTSARYRELLPTDAVSKQDTDTAVSQATSATAAVKAAEANVKRLEALQGFEKIYAPFDGILTARNVDIGQLVSAGTAGGTASQLFHIAAVQTLRVYVALPQSYGAAAQPGMCADLTFNEYPGKTFPAEVVRTARYIDPGSRTLLVELNYDNHGGELTAGAYAQVHLHLPEAVHSVSIPVTALLFRQEGLRVAVVNSSADGSSRAQLVPVTLGADDGRTVQVVNGLSAHSRVVQNPPDSLVDGEEVRLVNAADSQRGGPAPAKDAS